MRMIDLIEKKKIGEELSTDEINEMISAYTKGDIPDYQMSAFLMAVCFKGMNDRETYDLTMAMMHSGDVLDLSDIKGIKVDKHSSGGVGDKTTIALTPIVASLGVPVAKMSGRGLGHTGGTIDKLESFKGFETGISEETFVNNVNTIGIAVAGQTANLAPADKKLYALRDTTATVSNTSLIASSIMSKKLASGSDGIVLDVKVGDGAFMKNVEDATDLAEKMVAIGKSAGRKVTAVLTNMEQPLGNAVGNSLEVIEAIETLKGNGPKDFVELIYALATEMLLIGEIASDESEAKELIDDAINSGKALNKLREFVVAQKGDPSPIEDYSLFPGAKYVEDLKIEKEGYVSSIKAERIGHASMLLGGGRVDKDSVIDLGVGIVLEKKVSDAVNCGETIAKIYANDFSNIEEVKNEVLSAFSISKEKPNAESIVIKKIR